MLSAQMARTSVAYKQKKIWVCASSQEGPRFSTHPPAPLAASDATDSRILLYILPAPFPAFASFKHFKIPARGVTILGLSPHFGFLW